MTAPALAKPVTVALMQTAPGVWTVEVSMGGVSRYISVGLRSRREAMDAVVEWLEQWERIQ